jgi:hypothetical protein
MQYPSKDELESKIKHDKLAIGAGLIDHPSFPLLLKALKTDSLTFSSPEVSVKEGTSNVVVRGKSLFLSKPVTKAHLYLYHDPESKNDFEFEWHGTLPSVSLAYLYNNGILNPVKYNLVKELFSEVFQEVDLLYTSEDSAFAIEAVASDLKIGFPEAGLILDKIGFFYEISLNKSIKTTHLLYSTVKFGSTTVATEIELPAGNKFDPGCWCLTLKDTVILNNGLNDIMSFLKGQQSLKSALGDDLVGLLPEAVQKIPAFALTDLALHFNPQNKQLHLFRFSIQSFGKFEIVPGFSIDAIGVSAFMPFVNNKVSCNLTLFGVFAFGESVMADISIEIPFDSKADWSIAMQGEVKLPKLESLDKIGFIKLDELNIPPEWFHAETIQLENLNIIFNPIQGKIKSAGFSLQLLAKSSLIPGITLKNPSLEFNLNF